MENPKQAERAERLLGRFLFQSNHFLAWALGAELFLLSWGFQLSESRGLGINDVTVFNDLF